jgi:hypothetical protein
MNKRIIACLISSLFLGAFKPAVAMHGKVLRGVQVLTGGSLVVAGATLSYQMKKQKESPVYGVPMSPVVQQLIRVDLNKLGVATADSVPLLHLPTDNGWAVVGDKAVVCSRSEAYILENALLAKANFLEAHDKLIATRDQWKRENEIIKNIPSEVLRTSRARDYYHSSDEFDALDRLSHKIQLGIVACDKDIARSKTTVKHECKHYLNQDTKKRMEALVAIPVAVQAGCSTLTYGLNKLLNIEPPKTVLRTLLRSALSVGAIMPKTGISFVGLILYTRYQESEADRFACERAESRLELSERVAEFKEDEKNAKNSAMQYMSNFADMDKKSQDRLVRLFEFIIDKKHPYSGDRAAMAQEYLDKWDAEHKA